jgi:membrane protein required for colicin V production
VIIDIVLLIPIIWGAYEGFKKGILSEIVGVLHFSIAFAIAFKLIGFTIKVVDDYFLPNPNFYPQIAFALAIFAALLLMNKVGSRFKTEVDFDFPGNWDNIVGAIFGVLKYCFMLSFLVWFITSFGTMRPTLTDKAFVYPVIESLGPTSVGGKTKQDLSDAIKKAL